MLIKPKKSLGQNFLKEKNIIEKIVSSIDISGQDILEVGPGTGNMTEFILEKKPNKVFVVEKDNTLSKYLRNKFNDKINIINEDILKIDPGSLSKKKLIVFGNLPYNISSQILSNWIKNLKEEPWFSDLVLMFQKEVANRIISKKNTSNYGRLTILSQWRLKIEKLFDVSPNCFNPKPKVDSSVLHFENKKKFKKISNIKNLEYVTNILFGQRRKMIKHTLKKIFVDYVSIAEQLNIDLSCRPQNLDLKTIFELVEIHEKLRN